MSYDIWYNMMWYMIYDVMLCYVLWYDMRYDIWDIWYMWCDIYDMIWYDMIWYVIGLTPGGSSTVQ
jgi:hypothetical protein